MSLFSIKTWKDTIAQYPNRRILTKTDKTTETVTVARSLGTVTQQGDMFNATTMNDLETRISSSFSKVNDLANTLPNLINPNYYSFRTKGQSATINGVTFTVNDDGSITANGTASYTNGASSGNAIFQIMAMGDYKAKAGTYTLIGCTSDGTSKFKVGAEYETATDYIGQYAYDKGNGCTFTITEEQSEQYFLRIPITIYKGVTVENEVFKPILVEGSIAPTQYSKGQWVGTLTSGSTTLTILDDRITTDSTVHTMEVFASPSTVDGSFEPISPTAYEYSDGSCTLTFDEQEVDYTVAVKIS